MKTDSKLARIGSYMFAASFLLSGVTFSYTSFDYHWPGFICALLTFNFSLDVIIGVKTIKGVSDIAYIVSGWINPIFLISMVFKLNFGENWFTKSMMYFTFFMFPFCWIVFHFDHLYPREGYFLWTAGMTLMLLYKPK